MELTSTTKSPFHQSTGVILFGGDGSGNGVPFEPQADNHTPQKRWGVLGLVVDLPEGEGQKPLPWAPRTGAPVIVFWHRPSKLCNLPTCLGKSEVQDLLQRWEAVAKI